MRDPTLRFGGLRENGLFTAIDDGADDPGGGSSLLHSAKRDLFNGNSNLDGGAGLTTA